jgi:hypothetical protein
MENHDMEKRMKQKYKTQWKAKPADWNKLKTESQKLKINEIKGKIEELLVKELKTCERNMQELTDSIKRPSLRIMGIEEEVQGKGICIIFNKIINKHFTNLEKVMPIQVQEASRTPNKLDQNRTTT